MDGWMDMHEALALYTLRYAMLCDTARWTMRQR